MDAPCASMKEVINVRRAAKAELFHHLDVITAGRKARCRFRLIYAVHHFSNTSRTV